MTCCFQELVASSDANVEREGEVGEGGGGGEAAVVVRVLLVKKFQGFLQL